MASIIRVDGAFPYGGLVIIYDEILDAVADGTEPFSFRRSGTQTPTYTGDSAGPFRAVYVYSDTPYAQEESGDFRDFRNVVRGLGRDVDVDLTPWPRPPLDEAWPFSATWTNAGRYPGPRTPTITQVQLSDGQVGVFWSDQPRLIDALDQIFHIRWRPALPRGTGEVGRRAITVPDTYDPIDVYLERLGDMGLNDSGELYAFDPGETPASYGTMTFTGAPGGRNYTWQHVVGIANNRILNTSQTIEYALFQLIGTEARYLTDVAQPSNVFNTRRLNLWSFAGNSRVYHLRTDTLFGDFTISGFNRETLRYTTPVALPVDLTTGAVDYSERRVPYGNGVQSQNIYANGYYPSLQREVLVFGSNRLTGLGGDSGMMIWDQGMWALGGNGSGARPSGLPSGAPLAIVRRTDGDAGGTHEAGRDGHSYYAAWRDGTTYSIHRIWPKERALSYVDSYLSEHLQDITLGSGSGGVSLYSVPPQTDPSTDAETLYEDTSSNDVTKLTLTYDALDEVTLTASYAPGFSVGSKAIFMDFGEGVTRLTGGGPWTFEDGEDQDFDAITDIRAGDIIPFVVADADSIRFGPPGPVSGGFDLAPYAATLGRETWRKLTSDGSTIWIYNSARRTGSLVPSLRAFDLDTGARLPNLDVTMPSFTTEEGFTNGRRRYYGLQLHRGNFYSNASRWTRSSGNRVDGYVRMVCFNSSGNRVTANEFEIEDDGQNSRHEYLSFWIDPDTENVYFIQGLFGAEGVVCYSSIGEPIPEESFRLNDVSDTVRDITGDSEYLYVVNSAPTAIHRYNRRTQQLDPSYTVDLRGDPIYDDRAENPQAIWSDGRDWWVLEYKTRLNPREQSVIKYQGPPEWNGTCCVGEKHHVITGLTNGNLMTIGLRAEDAGGESQERFITAFARQPDAPVQPGAPVLSNAEDAVLVQWREV